MIACNFRTTVFCPKLGSSVRVDYDLTTGASWFWSDLLGERMFYLNRVHKIDYFMYSSWIDFVSLRIDDLMFLWRWGFLISTGSLEKGCSTSVRSIQTILVFTVWTNAVSLNLKDSFGFAMVCQRVELDSLWLWRLLLLDTYSIFLKLAASW